ncbi:NAD(P)(+) transhydrogenase (Re/Si-specific) subunit beta [Desulfosediminicola flagellatus]|uniref:NAD(P)(+) transhydrogenase (Re/Si-specific) subunit beta n=1 Tax=Desulfosediminicola flagellatus TaxID=2569541 RepID=UPI0010ACA23D|nr:NAD(P)(+) transhydrogenase (Re/Si-specific) subunit beta [Desulfosediminicola flagellatus]
MNLFIDFTVIAILIAGIWQFRFPHTAKNGNLTAAFALFLAFVLILYRNGIVDVGTVVISLVVGSLAGYALARVVTMIQVPAMVAFQHGCGGVAAFLVALVELSRTSHGLSLVSEISGVLGLAIGSLTFSGSMIASAKLANKMRQAPQFLDNHNLYVIINLVAIVVVGALSLVVAHGFALFLFTVEILLGTCLGTLVAMRIGGADMPVLISSLNATAGVAAALCGMIIENQLLIAFGATVAASGSILTYVMCKAMNRKLGKVIFPDYKPKKAGLQIPVIDTVAPEQQPVPAAALAGENDQAAATCVLTDAKRIIIVPGYGMALAKAQTEVATLADELIAMGKDVKYAIHPVAGRMPGHMNVLLAEAGVDYDMLVEMEAINQEFEVTDLVLVVGACDVVNPSAVEVEGTPISGMPILMAYKAKNVICCNFDRNPGYSGVENSLYEQDNTVLLEGDAKKSIQELQKLLISKTKPQKNTPSTDMAAADAFSESAEALAAAKSVVVIPGYGMALAKAQFKLVEMVSLLEQRGVSVKYAIHPVAGRMPGHMNVLLAEADVEYENLLEMDDVNPMFRETDVAIVVGACDVVNPAAIESEGTPISGMPILLPQDAKHIIICNFDTNPGYSGVPNPLYNTSKTILLTGDARETINNLYAVLQNIDV